MKGLSGLNAALKLYDSNMKDIVVLEARYYFFKKKYI